MTSSHLARCGQARNSIFSYLNTYFLDFSTALSFPHPYEEFRVQTLDLPMVGRAARILAPLPYGLAINLSP